MQSTCSGREPLEQLLAAIRTAARGQKYVSPELAQLLAGALAGNAGEARLHESLSQREFQIFGKLAAGLSVSAIAESLNLSVKTISTYRTRLLDKMGMKSNADLIAYAIHNGLIDWAGAAEPRGAPRLQAALLSRIWRAISLARSFSARRRATSSGATRSMLLKSSFQR